jgi:hypothetical protein
MYLSEVLIIFVLEIVRFQLEFKLPVAVSDHSSVIKIHRTSMFSIFASLHASSVDLVLAAF